MADLITAAIGIAGVAFILALAVAYFVQDHQADRQYRNAMDEASGDDAFAADVRRFAVRRERSG